jgi:hypothetical protein
MLLNKTKFAGKAENGTLYHESEEDIDQIIVGGLDTCLYVTNV